MNSRFSFLNLKNIFRGNQVNLLLQMLTTGCMSLTARDAKEEGKQIQCLNGQVHAGTISGLLIQKMTTSFLTVRRKNTGCLSIFISVVQNMLCFTFSAAASGIKCFLILALFQQMSPIRSFSTRG